jgi:hypothetical protein
MDIFDIPPISDHVVEALNEMSSREIVHEMHEWQTILDSRLVSPETQVVVNELIAVFGNILSSRVAAGEQIVDYEA